MHYRASDIATIINGKGSITKDRLITNVIIDSRLQHINANTLFFALEGPNNNGHHYIPQLIKRGIQTFVVSCRSTLEKTGATFIEVEDTKEALQQFASYHRSQFTIPIVGITGSNGKTTLKEWIASSLIYEEKIVKTPGSQNSQVGVPLAVLQIEQHHTLGIFEAGISTTNEMIHQQAVIKPTVGILTNIGSAHDYGFLNREEKIKEKLALFTETAVVICQEQYARYLPNKTFTYGGSPNAQLQYKTKGSSLVLSYENEQISISLEENTPAFINNVLSFSSYHLQRGRQLIELRALINQLPKVSSRLEIKDGIRNITLIDDSYNNDFEGMQRALEILEQQPGKKSYVISLFDDAKTNTRLGEIIDANAYKDQIIIGDHSPINELQHSFLSVEDFIASDTFASLKQTTLLVKGSSQLSFRSITNALQQEHHNTVFEINLQALQHNLNAFRQQLNQSTKIMLMVKAFGYGTEAYTIAQLAQHNNIDYLGVAYLDEGLKLRKAGVTTPIMVMNPNLDQLSTYIKHQLEPEVFSIRSLERISQFSTEIKIHIKIDTGMHRLGFEPQDIDTLLLVLKTNKKIKVASIFTHLATADNKAQEAFTLQQINTYNKQAEKIISTLGYTPIRHILNSSGIVNYTLHQKDMVRLGIGLYGGLKNSALQLKAVGTLRTRISQIKNLPATETVGYARQGLLEKETKIATIAIGYADGYDRRFGNGHGKVIINNQMAKTIGNICMDMTMIDVSGIDAQEGDDVFLINEQQSIFDLAAQINTIPYEILTNISERVVRSKVRV